MSSEQVATEAETVQVETRNIGGISETEVKFKPGVTILAGRNATNRTSLLRAIMLALGSEETSLKADADHGEVKLSIGEETYRRTMTRQGDSVVVKGNPYLEMPKPRIYSLLSPTWPTSCSSPSPRCSLRTYEYSPMIISASQRFGALGP